MTRAGATGFVAALLLAGCGGGVSQTIFGDPAAKGPLVGRWVGEYQHPEDHPEGTHDLTIDIRTHDLEGNFAGVWRTNRGGRGDIAGSVVDGVVAFTLTYALPGCTGSFKGEGNLVSDPEGERIDFLLTGIDCGVLVKDIPGFVARP